MSKDGVQKCSKWSYVGFEIFKILILIIIMLTLAYWLEKRTFGKDGWVSKFKQARQKTKYRKLEKMQAKLKQKGIIMLGPLVIEKT